MPSSERATPSEKVSGSLGTSCSSAATEWVVVAMSTYCAPAAAGALSRVEPPVMKRYAVVVSTRSGLTMVSQCFQTVRSTSDGLRHVWEVNSTTKEVYPSPLTVLTTL